MKERMINRLVLLFLDDLRGIPQGFEEISEYVSRRLRRPSGELVERALAALESAGYAEQTQRTQADERLWKITAAGIRQATKNVPSLDPLIWD